MAESLYGIRRKIERADHHIDDLDLEIRRFLDSDPYPVSAEYNANVRKTEYRAIRCKNIPGVIPVTAGDAIHNLRSALDYLAYGLVKAAGVEPTRDTGFPISCEKSPEEYETFMETKVKGVVEGVKKHMRDLYADKARYCLLCALHELDITDKHKLLPIVSHAASGWGFDLDAVEMGSIFPGFATKAFMEPIPISEKRLGFKPGDIVATLPGNTESQEDIHFAFEVAFGEPEVIKGSPVVKTLQEIRALINNLGGAFIPFLG
jgi:hypothetical protein